MGLREDIEAQLRERQEGPKVCAFPTRAGKLEGILCGEPAVTTWLGVGPVCEQHLQELQGQTKGESAPLGAPDLPPVPISPSIAASAGLAFMSGAFGGEVGADGNTPDGRASITADPSTWPAEPHQGVAADPLPFPPSAVAEGLRPTPQPFAARVYDVAVTLEKLHEFGCVPEQEVRDYFPRLRAALRLFYHPVEVHRESLGSLFESSVFPPGGHGTVCACGQAYAFLVGRIICHCGRELAGLTSGYGRPRQPGEVMPLSVAPVEVVHGPLLLAELHRKVIENQGARFLVSDDLLADLCERIEEYADDPGSLVNQYQREPVTFGGGRAAPLAETADAIALAVQVNEPVPAFTPAGELAIQGTRLALCLRTVLQALTVGSEAAPVDEETDIPDGWVTISGALPRELWDRLVELSRYDDPLPLAGREGYGALADGEPEEADPESEAAARDRLRRRPAASWSVRPKTGELDGDD